MNFISDWQKCRYSEEFYLAHEGINAQVSVPLARIDEFRSYLETIEALKGIRLNTALDDDGKSFWVLKIKVRTKIVADGIKDPEFSMEKKGQVRRC